MRESSYRIATKEEEYRAQKMLSIAKKDEQKKIDMGWKWHNIDKTTRILIPCDEKGKPTQQGKRMIDLQKNAMSII